MFRGEDKYGKLPKDRVWSLMSLVPIYLILLHVYPIAGVMVMLLFIWLMMKREQSPKYENCSNCGSNSISWDFRVNSNRAECRMCGLVTIHKSGYYKVWTYGGPHTMEREPPKKRQLGNAVFKGTNTPVMIDDYPAACYPFVSNSNGIICCHNEKEFS